MFPMKTTKTAQYAAVAANTSSRLALVNTEIAEANMKANPRVIAAIILTEKWQLKKTYVGTNIKIEETSAMIILMAVPSRDSE